MNGRKKGGREKVRREEEIKDEREDEKQKGWKEEKGRKEERQKESKQHALMNEHQKYRKDVRLFWHQPLFRCLVMGSLSHHRHKVLHERR